VISRGVPSYQTCDQQRGTIIPEKPTAHFYHMDKNMKIGIAGTCPPNYDVTSHQTAIFVFFSCQKLSCQKNELR
jgi:hypothetical protein